MRHLQNDERPFPFEKFRPNSTFTPGNKDTAAETCFSWLQERLLDIHISSRNVE